MKIVEVDGKLFELSAISPIGEDGVMVEAWEMSPEGGLTFRLRQLPSGQLTLEPIASRIPMPAIAAAVELLEVAN